MNTTIFFLRHGEPDNSQKILYGLAPIPLTPLGKKQVAVQAQKLILEEISAIFSSPTLRGQQSAKIAAKTLRLKAEVDDRLTEWTSKLDGRPLSQVKTLSLVKYNSNFELQDKVLGRMRDFIKMVLEKYPGKTILAVSHQGPIDLLLFNLQGKDTSQFPGQGLITVKGELIKVVFDREGNLETCQRIKSDLKSK